MTDKELADRIPGLRAIAEAATPGPWFTHAACGHESVLASADDALVADCAIFLNPRFGKRDVDTNRANAAFIVTARNEWSALLTRIDQLSARVMELEGAASVYCARLDAYAGVMPEDAAKLAEQLEAVGGAKAASTGGGFAEERAAKFIRLISGRLIASESALAAERATRGELIAPESE